MADTNTGPTGVAARRQIAVLVLLTAVLLTLLATGAGVAWNLRLILHRISDVKHELITAQNRAFQLEADRYHQELLSQPRYQDPKRLNRYESKIFSQNGEDGITLEIFRRIGTTNRVFTEFGSADGGENNTAVFLNAGWSGLWIDGDR